MQPDTWHFRWWIPGRRDGGEWRDTRCLWREGGVWPSAASCRGCRGVGGSLQKGQDMAAAHVFPLPPEGAPDVSWDKQSRLWQWEQSNFICKDRWFVFSEILFCSFFFQSLGPHCKAAGITTSFPQTSLCISDGIAYGIHGFFINNALDAAATLLQVSGEASLLSSTKTALLRTLKERKKYRDEKLEAFCLKALPFSSRTSGDRTSGNCMQPNLSVAWLHSPCCTWTSSPQSWTSSPQSCTSTPQSWTSTPQSWPPSPEHQPPNPEPQPPSPEPQPPSPEPQPPSPDHQPQTNDPIPVHQAESIKKPPLSPTKRSFRAEFRSVRKAVSFLEQRKVSLQKEIDDLALRKRTAQSQLFYQKCKQTGKSFERSCCCVSENKRRVAEQLYHKWPTICRKKWRAAECKR